MTVFTNDERTFLRDLKREPTWTRIIEKLEGSTRAKPFRPRKGDTAQQVDDWKYDSGFDAGVESVIKSLTDG